MSLLPKVVYEDNNVLVINKPFHLITHKKNINDTQPTVVDWVIRNYPDVKKVGEFFIASGSEVPRAGIVHRLDKDTSGLMVIAKTDDSFTYFKGLFQTRTINKQYLALVHGKLKNASGIIDSPLGRIGLKRTTKIDGKKLIDKKDALTEYKTLRYFPAKDGSASDRERFTLLELTPKTGRTHQLRVHLNSIGHPIIGDPVYGSKKLADPLGTTRLFLHAYKLQFTGPDGKALNIEADIPDDLQKILNMLN